MMEWFAWLAFSKCLSVRGRFSAAVSMSWISTDGSSTLRWLPPPKRRKDGIEIRGRLNIVLSECRDVSEQLFEQLRG
jgi:hypothetical protein